MKKYSNTTWKETPSILKFSFAVVGLSVIIGLLIILLSFFTREGLVGGAIITLISGLSLTAIYNKSYRKDIVIDDDSISYKGYHFSIQEIKTARIITLGYGSRFLFVSKKEAKNVEKPYFNSVDGVRIPYGGNSELKEALFSFMERNNVIISKDIDL